jgi:hypothetical protein
MKRERIEICREREGVRGKRVACILEIERNGKSFSEELRMLCECDDGA